MPKETGAVAELLYEPPEDFRLFGDGRDRAFVNAMGATLARERRIGRARLDEALAERVVPQLKKIAALELKVAELTGALDVLRGAAPPPPAKFPSVRSWTENTVYHEGDIVAFAGGSYQARRDTAQVPGTADWACVARAGRDGASLTVRGTYNPRDAYAHLDVVAYNGASFCARRSGPGPCPGPDWQLIAKIGKSGPRGERGMMGLRGERGEAAPTIQSWVIDRTRYTATPMMSDGSIGSSLELRALFEQFLLETQS